MPRWSSLLSVGCVTALGWTVVSMVTRRRCFSSTAPPRCAAARLSASSTSSRSGADALAPARHRGAVQRQGVLEVGLAAEQLRHTGCPGSGAQTASSDSPSMCLTRCRPTMRRVGSPGRPTRPCRAARTPPRTGPSRSARPGAPAGAAGPPGSPAAHGRGRPAARPRAASGASAASLPGAADRITPRPAPQPTVRFARFCPSIRAEPAKPDTSRAPENRRKPPRSAYFTGDY